MAQHSVIFYDLETTGFKREEDHIIEIACVREHDSKDFSTFIKLPENTNIPQVIVKLTGISDEQLDKEGKSLSEAIESFEKFVGSHATLIAHNNFRFDKQFLIRAYQRINREIPKGWDFMDSYQLAKKVLIKAPKGTYNGKYTLGGLAEYLKITPHGRVHRALTDALLVKYIWKELIRIENDSK